MNKNPSPIEQIKDELLESNGVELFIKREDQNHPTIQGNKYWKLLYNIKEAQKLKQETIITFGGAFSNHIYATAAAGKAFGLKTIGIIRGERIEPLNATLRNAEAFGMKLHFVSRTEYRNKNKIDFLDNLKTKFGESYIIPEGGTNDFAIKGCQELAQEINFQGNYDVIGLSVGTGGTIAGLITGFEANQTILGFSSLKGDFLYKEVKNLIFNYNQKKYSNWNIENQYHFGGYGKYKKELIDFINDFNEKHNILLDPIYTGKMMFGIYDQIQNRKYLRGTRILVIHTGGLQGVAGFNERYGNIIL